MSSKLQTASELRDQLIEKYQQQKEERDNCCRHLAALSGVFIPSGADPYDAFDDSKEMAEVRRDEESKHLIDQINNLTLDMRALKELIRTA